MVEIMQKLKRLIKEYLPDPLTGILRWGYDIYKFYISIIAYFWQPLNTIKFFIIRKLYFNKAANSKSERVFNYRYELLPNSFLSNQERGIVDIDSAVQKTGLTIGYPAWNLLYYSLFCSLSDKSREPIIIETGTNLGYSTIVMAQVLKDINSKGYIHTIDIDAKNIEAAKHNIEKAGLSEYVKFYNGNALIFLKNFVKENRYIDFIFIDDLHKYEHIIKEFSIVYPRIVACNGKAYFDNTSRGDVQRALVFIKRAYPGNLVEFNNCSWSPPGNAIWQP